MAVMQLDLSYLDTLVDEELKGAEAPLFHWGADNRRAPNFHYNTPQSFCQVKNTKILHKKFS